MNIKSEIERALSVLIGQRVLGFTRAADMLTFQIGPEIVETIPSRFTKRNPERLAAWFREGRRRPKYAIHVQTAWNFRDAEHIIVGSNDFYNPIVKMTYEEESNWEWSDGKNLFDKASAELGSLFKNQIIVVEGIESDIYGGISLYLSNGFILQIFIHSTEKREFWRFFELSENPNNDLPHFVVFEEDD